MNDINPDWHELEDGQWETGTGQRVSKVHSATKCAGQRCTVHNPYDHHMRSFPTHLRGESPFDMSIFTERICSHGVGHPDPDDPLAPGTHGCDGCCVPPEEAT